MTVVIARSHPGKGMAQAIARDGIDAQVLGVLRRHYPDWMGPTEIGLKLGYRYDRASSAVMPSLRRLVAAGLVERAQHPRGRYRARTSNARGDSRP